MKFKALAAGLLALALASPLAAQTYPTRPVTMVVPFAAGGPTDTVARLIGQVMSRDLGQTVVIENVGGAGGTLGAQRVARAEPDGYTVLLHHIGQATSATLYRRLAYNTLTDFTPIGLVADVPMSIVARKEFPANTMAELVNVLKTQKDKISLANAGIGAASHLCGMLLMSALDVPLTTVPYRGTGPAMNDLVAGHVDVMCDQTTNTTEQIKAGTIKAFAVTSAARVPSLANLPTTTEVGLPNLKVAVWHGIYGPKNLPQPVVDRLVRALHVALQDAGVKERLAALGTEPVSLDLATPAAHAAHLNAEIERWRPIIQAAGQFAD